MQAEFNTSELYHNFIKAIRPVLGDIITSYEKLDTKIKNNNDFHVTDFPDHERKSVVFVEYCLDFTQYLNVHLNEKHEVLQKACVNMQHTINTQLHHVLSEPEADARSLLRFTTLYANMDNDLGLFGKNTILSDIIYEVPYIFWLLLCKSSFGIYPAC